MDLSSMPLSMLEELGMSLYLSGVYPVRRTTVILSVRTLNGAYTGR